MQSFITVDRLQIHARHGVLEQERAVGNLFEVSVTVEYDITKAAENDDIQSAVNYAELTDTIVDEMNRSRKLLETVAINIKNRIMERWPEISSGIVSITKLHPPIPSPTPRATITITW